MLITNFRILLLCAAILLGATARESAAQTGPPAAVFRAPIDIKLFLSGNFGEVRSNHFHSGIDLKTDGQPGLPVHACYDGYVSRIKVEPGGYGNALYLKHPNGYTSVYGHLQEFDDQLEDYVVDQQYSRESFSVDLFPPEGKFAYRQGDLIGKSGNSGSSMGPHLHFEIRDSRTENPINPLLYPFSITDNLPPEIYELRIYSLSGRNELKNPKVLKAYGSSGKYYINAGQPVLVDSAFGVGIETIDFLNGSSNKCGVFSIKGYIDGELYFHSEIDEFSFAESRYINSFVDYREYQDSRSSLYKTFIDPNNHLSILQFAKNRGIIEPGDGEIHNLLLEVSDVYGNKSSIGLKVKADTSHILTQPEELPFYNAFFHYDENNFFEDDNIKAAIPRNALYNNLFFQYESGPSPAGTYSRIHSVHDPGVPLHKNMTLSIRPDSLPAPLKPFALVARKNNNSFVSAGGKWEGDYLVVSTRSFGDYTIMVDTVKPVIRPRNFSNGKDILNLEKIMFTIYDDFSGISDYRGEIDGKWALFEYDPKNRLLYYDTGKKPLDRSKSHRLVLKLTDGAGNKSEYNLEIN